ncbi:MAG: tetratricopeptide repeat protein, partial [Planctomycetota bacterium]
QQLQRLHFLKQQAENPDTSSAESIISIEEMIVVAETLFGEEAPIVGKLNCQLAGIRQTAGDMDGASSNYHAGIDILREKYCPIHPEIVAAQSALANCYLEMGEFRTAIANLKASTSMAAQLFGEESLQYARQANQLGVAYYRGGDLDTAEQILKGAEAIRRQSLGEEHLLVGHSLLNVGIVMLDQRDYSSAVHCLERAESIFAGSTETSSELLFKSRNKLATVYMLIQQPDLAEPLLTLLIESRKAEFGDDHPDVAMFEFRYGIALARQGKYELAEPAFVHALEVQEEQLGLNNRETIKTIQAYAMLLARTGREDEAKAQAERIIRVASRPEGADSTIRKP